MMLLKQRDLVVLEALALRIRVIGLRQAADAFWYGHVANARRRLRQLVNAEMLSRAVVPAQPLPEIIQPIVRWQPGQPIPDANHVSCQLQSRWRFRALRPTVVYFPTEKTILQYGGRVRSNNKTTQVTHDLGLTAAWIRYFQQDSKLRSVWVGEEVLAPTRVNQKVPDAALVDQQGEPTLLIEFGGSYAAARVAAFHDDAAYRQLPYHLW